MFFDRHKIVVILVILISAFNTSLCAQNNNAAFAAADTSSFSVNNRDGWKLFNSYTTAYQTDSVILEIIIQHANNIDWAQEHYVGRIKKSELIPKNQQNLLYSLIVSSYNIRVDSEGRCYLRHVAGMLPQQDPCIIPLRVVYRKE